MPGATGKDIVEMAKKRIRERLNQERGGSMEEMLGGGKERVEDALEANREPVQENLGGGEEAVEEMKRKARKELLKRYSNNQ